MIAPVAGAVKRRQSNRRSAALLLLAEATHLVALAVLGRRS